MTRALLYLEWVHARNQVLAIKHNPQRLAIWLPTIAALFVLYASRYDRHALPGARPSLDPLAAGAIGALFVAMAATAAALALGGRTAVYRSPAEAVLFANIGVPPLLVAVWLQLRKLASSLRIVTGAIYLLVFVAPLHGGSPLAAVRGLGIALMTFAIPTCIQLPAFLLRRSPVAGALRGAMWGVALSAAAVAGGMLFGGARGRAWIREAHLDFGPFVHALVGGDPLAAAVIAVIVVALVLSIAVLGKDAIPEFYAVSTQNVLERVRRRDSRVRTTYAVRRSNWRMPSGVFSYVWKDWIAFRRGRGKLRLWLIGIAFSATIGVAVAFTNDIVSIGILAVTSLMFLVGVAPIAAGEDLAADLSKPLFWLSGDSLVLRIAAITFGRGARTGFTLGIAPLCAALFDDRFVLAIAALPIAVVLAWSLQAMGTALFALFPATIDQRGPVVYLRLVLGVVLLVPVMIAAATGFMLAQAGGSILAAILAAGAQGAIALAIAANRFERRGGAAFARLAT